MAGWSSLKCALIASSIFTITTARPTEGLARREYQLQNEYNYYAEDNNYYSYQDDKDEPVDPTPAGYQHEVSNVSKATMTTSSRLARETKATATPSSSPTNTPNSSKGEYDPTSLEDFQGSYGSDPKGTVIVTGVQNGRTAVRKEIRELIKSPTEFSLFIMALYRLEKQPQSMETSYYGIAGIHGAPFKAWGGVELQDGGNPDWGYCPHSDVLFLPWHRPYMALIEQVMWKHASDIVDGIPEGPKKEKFKAVLPSLRFPYWDWAADGSIPEEVCQQNLIQIETVRHDRESVQNPLFSYWFSDLSEFKNYPWGNITETIRFPAKFGTPTTHIREINAVMKANEGTWRNRVYQVLTGYKTFTSMASTGYDRANGFRFESFEGIHGGVHLAVGQNLDGLGSGTILGVDGAMLGHMDPPVYSAFDPISWLHHINVDRIFTMWQTLNPDAYKFSGRTRMGTWAVPFNTVVDEKTPLYPFRKSADAFFTGADVEDPKQFGYSYAETDSGNSRDTLIAINKLYGARTPAFTIKNARDGSRRQKRQETNPVASVVDGSNKYTDWIINIEVNNGAEVGTFGLNAFLGEPSTENAAKWITDPNSVGVHGVLTRFDAHPDVLVTGTIPLTAALLKKVESKEIESLLPDVVVPYLLKNLKLKVRTAMDGIVEDLKEVKDLKVQIVAGEVGLPKDMATAPTYSEYQSKIDWIDVAAGKLTPIAV
ncbi:uncharacterized protein DFL_000614 [Arthrobotrys flagrans]|uniref:tyrosinase n=2 Tax=Arthrobotrys flagrans TaxID=97331 RepID=A0A437AEF9_ARTFL|nr:hypothetical protein DFL_000614 [Arthrobotrys flagrans]